MCVYIYYISNVSFDFHLRWWFRPWLAKQKEVLLLIHSPYPEPINVRFFFISWVPNTHQTRKIQGSQTGGTATWWILAPWQLRFDTRIWCSIKLASWSSFENSGWKTICVTLCWRAVTVENTVPTLLSYPLPASFSRSCWADPFWRPTGCNEDSQWKLLRLKQLCPPCLTMSMVGSPRWIWKLVLNYYDWRKPTICQS